MAANSTQSAVRRDNLEELFNGASISVDRLPMLQVALERTAAACAEDLRKDSASPPQMTLQRIETGTAADLLAQCDGTCIIGVLHAPKWNARLLACADRDAAFAVVEMLLGADGSEPPYASERQFSKAESKIARILFERMASALEAAFASIAETPIIVETVSTRIDFDLIGRRNNSVLVARFALRVLERGGVVSLVVPQSVVSPMRELLGRATPEDTTVPDPGWTKQIQDGFTRTSVSLRAVLDERLASLDEISNLEVGQIMALNATTRSRVRVECNGEPLLWCQLGKSDGVYTLRVDEFIDREQEFMDDILFG